MMILVKVTQARCVLTTNFWMTGYAAYVCAVQRHGLSPGVNPAR
jgi:hypothetical protein